MKTKSEKECFADMMAQKPTPAELEFREALERYGVVYVTQVRIGFYIADFVILNKMLIIEIDGKSHESTKQYDNRRDIFMRKCGFKTIRIQNRDVGKFDINRLLEMKSVKPEKTVKYLKEAEWFQHSQENRGKKMKERRKLVDIARSEDRLLFSNRDGVQIKGAVIVKP